MNVKMISLEKLVNDPNNPRTEIRDENLDDMIVSVTTHGIKVPLIAYEQLPNFALVEGHRRLQAARLAGLQEVPVIVWKEKPSEAEVLCAQLTINGHREALNPVDEYLSFVRLMKLKGCSPSELAATLAIKMPEVTRVLSLGKLSSEELQLVRNGSISKSAAYSLSRMPTEERSAVIPKVVSGEVTRDQLNQKAKRTKTSDAAKMRRVSFSVPEGMVSLHSTSGLTLQSVIETLEDLIRSCRKYKSQGLDINTAVRVARDQIESSSLAN